MKTSPQVISDKLKELGVHIRTDREQALKYSVNEDFFETINTDEKAYWLGFMYADGYINKKRKHNTRRMGISLNVKDIECLETFKKALEYTGPINIYEVAQGYSQEANMQDCW